MALAVSLSFFTIYIGNLKISFYAIVTGFVGFMFGPFVSGAFAGLLDILQFLIKPVGTFQPCWTLNSIISGLIYGFGLYKQEVSFKRTFFTRAISGVVVSVFLTTFWLYIYYGIGSVYKLPITLLKEIILIFIHTFILYKLLKIKVK